MQVSRAHEAGLRRVGVDPTKHHDILALAKLHYFLLIVRLAGVARAGLLGDHQVTNKEGVVDGCATEYAAHLQTLTCVGCSMFQEFFPQTSWEENRTDRGAILQVSGWSKRVSLFTTRLGGSLWDTGGVYWGRCLIRRASGRFIWSWRSRVRPVLGLMETVSHLGWAGWRMNRAAVIAVAHPVTVVLLGRGLGDRWVLVGWQSIVWGVVVGLVC